MYRLSGLCPVSWSPRCYGMACLITKQTNYTYAFPAVTYIRLCVAFPFPAGEAATGIATLICQCMVLREGLTLEVRARDACVCIGVRRWKDKACILCVVLLRPSCSRQHGEHGRHAG